MPARRGPPSCEYRKLEAGLPLIRRDLDRWEPSPSRTGSLYNPPAKEASMRARRFVLVVAVAFGGLALIPPPASAGGGWSIPGRSAYVPAQVAIVQGTFWEGAGEEAIADGPFFAYLLPTNRWIQEHRVPEAAIPVGQVMITLTNRHGYVARVE